MSNKWIEAADAAVQAMADTAPDAGVVIDQYVEGAPDYRVVIERHACSVRQLADLPDERPAAHAAFRQDLATAIDVVQGTTDAHQAFLLGQITFEGDIGVLIERRDAFTWLESALAPILTNTVFD